MLQIKLHPAFVTILIAGVIILVFALIKGCSNNRQAVSENKELKAKNKLLQAKIINDSTQFSEAEKGYSAKLEVANGQVEIKDNQLARTGIELDAANKRINALLSKYSPITPNTDTSHTLVPNEYINECAGCYEELQNGQQLVKKYRVDIDQLKLSYLNKGKLQENRINQLGVEKDTLFQRLTESKKINQEYENKFEPKGQLFFSWGILWAPFPKMAGVGLLYQTKRKVQYGAKGYWGVYGTMVETQMNMPLSLKREKR
jgi:hypothetical protein